FSFLRLTRLLYSLSTSLKSKPWPSSSRFSTAGTGKHMVSDPCSPTAAPALIPELCPEVSSLQCSLHTLSAGGFQCHSKSVCLHAVSLSNQSAALAPVKASCCASRDQVKLFLRTPSADAAHQGGTAALSCRLCLIACNSRKFTWSRCQAINRPGALEG